jgi:hypothetical protein
MNQGRDHTTPDIATGNHLTSRCAALQPFFLLNVATRSATLLCPKTMPISAEQAEERRAARKAKEKAKLAIVEAELPENERVFSTERDWDAFYVRQVSKSRESANRFAKTWFLDFVTDDSLDVLGIQCSQEEAEMYFSAPPHNKVPTIRLLRMFLEYHAKSRAGRINKYSG